MTRWSARLLSLAALGALLGGCADAAKDTVMGGNAEGVVVNYYGDVAQTLPLARQYCARFERQPVLRKTQDNNAFYACVRAAALPGAS